MENPKLCGCSLPSTPVSICSSTPFSDPRRGFPAPSTVIFDTIGTHHACKASPDGDSSQRELWADVEDALRDRIGVALEHTANPYRSLPTHSAVASPECGGAASRISPAKPPWWKPAFTPPIGPADKGAQNRQKDIRAF